MLSAYLMFPQSGDLISGLVSIDVVVGLQLIVQCVTILYTYRKFCATASSSGQLILPEALKLLPLYTMGMLAIPPLHGIHDHWHQFWKCSLCKPHKVVTGLLSSYLQIVGVEISLRIS
jgi:hypothetical protein